MLVMELQQVMVYHCSIRLQNLLYVARRPTRRKTVSRQQMQQPHELLPWPPGHWRPRRSVAAHQDARADCERVDVRRP